MDAASAGTKQTDHSSKKPSLVWIALRDSLISVSALSVVFVLRDFHANRQSIREYLFKGAFVTVCALLIGLGRAIALRDRGPKTDLHPDN